VGLLVISNPAISVRDCVHATSCMNAMPFAPIPAAFTLLLCQVIRAIKQIGCANRRGKNSA
jgi:hypothetical protein